jgi:predicted  nucleic acid-binding Zn-ribbon protein
MKSSRANTRTTTLFITFLLFISFAGLAQEEINVKQITEEMSKGRQPGFAVDIHQADLEIVQRDWIKYIQDDTREKAEKVDHEIQIIGAVDDEINHKPFNLYSILINKDTLVKLVAFIEIDSVFFDPKKYPEKLVSDKIESGIRNFLHEFAVEQYKDAVGIEIDDEEKILKSMNRELKDLEDEKEKLEKEITSSEQNITSAEDEVNLLDMEIDSKLSQIESSRLRISSMTDKETKKVAQKELKDLEKDKKKLDDKKTKMNKEIVGHQSDIKGFEKEIKKNLELQETKADEIKQQEELIKSLEDKLAAIK